MTRVDLGPSYTPENYEADDLSASPIACAVADAWVPLTKQRVDRSGTLRREARSYLLALLPEISKALSDLELATRHSPLRKMKP